MDNEKQEIKEKFRVRVERMERKQDGSWDYGKSIFEQEFIELDVSKLAIVLNTK